MQLNPQQLYSQFQFLLKVAVIVCLCVVILGAYVRLSNAGLGCPDWPGCYGKLIGIPETKSEISMAEQDFPHNKISTDKAWKEVAHRYLAGILGLLILALSIIALINRKYAYQSFKLPLLLLLIVIFQATLGMWTVTLLLMPAIVTLHLIGGLLTLAILWWLNLKHCTQFRKNILEPMPYLFKIAILCLILLSVQIVLGGWVSTNYAALACLDFPTCQQQWWPDANFSSAFQFSFKSNINYEFGIHDNATRTAIHISHRIGAVVVALILGMVFLTLLVGQSSPLLKKAAGISLLLLILQISLGISNVLFQLPLSIAVAHNAVAALLLLTMLTVIYMLKSR